MVSKKFQRLPLNATHEWHAIVKEATVRLSFSKQSRDIKYYREAKLDEL